MEEFQLDMEDSMSNIKNRNYSGSQWNEFILVFKKYILLMPLFLSAYICSNSTTIDYNKNIKTQTLLLSIGACMSILNQINKYPIVTILILATLHFSLNNEVYSYVYFEYLLYGIAWNVALKLCDYEDASLLFPGFALLHTPSLYVVSYTESHMKLVQGLCMCVMLIYVMLFHQKIKDCFNTDTHFSKKSELWWGAMGNVFLCSSTFLFHMCLTNTRNTFETLFDFYHFFEIDFLKYKGLCTFVVMFITNSQLFKHFTWKIPVYIMLISYIILFTLKLVLNNNNGVLDTVALGVHHYLTEPSYTIMYACLERKTWQHLVISNTLLKHIPLIINTYMYKTLIAQIVTFTSLIFSLCWGVYNIDFQFKQLDF